VGLVRWTLWATNLFFTKNVNAYLLPWWNTLLDSSQVAYSTETVITTSRLINKFDHCYSVV